MISIEYSWDFVFVELIRRKNPSGMTVLYNTCGGAIYGVTLPLVDHKMIAEKILSDTLIKVYHIEDFKPEHSSFFTWIMNIARSLAKDHIFADIKNPEDKNSRPIFDLIVNNGLSIEVVADLLAISKAACAMKLRAELMTISIK